MKNITRLYYSTEEASGELGKLKSLQFTGPSYKFAECSYLYPPVAFQSDAGELVFELEEPASTNDLIGFFNKAQQVEWTLEQENAQHVTFGFKGYVSEIESGTSFGSNTYKVKVKVCGAVTCWSDYVEKSDNSPVFSKAASEAQAVNLSSMLTRILMREPVVETCDCRLPTYPSHPAATHPEFATSEDEAPEYDEYEEMD